MKYPQFVLTEDRGTSSLSKAPKDVTEVPDMNWFSVIVDSPGALLIEFLLS
jgi:hypothetical protein